MIRTNDRIEAAGLSETAIGVLMDNLGIAETVRFLRECGVGGGDYTAERAASQTTETVDQIIRKHREEGRKTAPSIMIRHVAQAPFFDSGLRPDGTWTIVAATSTID